MFCKQCGHQVDDRSVFCLSCGTRLDYQNEYQPAGSAAAEPSAPAAPTPAAQPVRETAPAEQAPVEQAPATEAPQKVYRGGYVPPNLNGSGIGAQGSEPAFQAETVAQKAKKVKKAKKPQPKWKKWVKWAIILFLVYQFGSCCVWLFSDEEYESDADYNNESTGGIFSNEVSEGTYGTDLEITDLRDFYTTVKGDGEDEFTIMVYMLGSDLESMGGSASEDIQEMMDAQYGDNVNVIMMTGGATSWSNPNISADTCQYWQIANGELICLESNLGLLSMVSEDTLAQFIIYAQSNFPADRYGIILWDHGGGTMSGFGYDENYPNDMLTLENLSNAFAAGGVLFDFVGFDACLMATAETAYMLEPYADYLIASEETEPATGWAYSDWLTELGANTSISTVDLGVLIIDYYIESLMRFEEGTLSIIELRQMPYTYVQMCEYFADASDVLDSDDYSTLSIARSNVKDFGESGFDQVDIIDFANEAALDGSDDLITAVNSAVKYYSSTSIMSDTYGMAMYFPYDYPEYYSEIQAILENVGYTVDYTNFFSQFISAMVGGQNSHRRSTGGTETVDYSSESWYDADVATSYEESYDTSLSEQLVIVEKGDTFVLQLSDATWDTITMIELQVLLDDGEGYIDLGSDNMYEFDRDGDLLIEFDYTWVTLDGYTVPFYAEKEEETADGGWYTYGSVPAVLNGSDYIEVIVYWDDENPTGYVAGYRMMSETGAAMGKGLFEFTAGDTLEWLFDYYDYDLYYEDSYIIGDAYTYTGGEIEVSYDDVGDLDAYVYFVLTDTFNVQYYTEAIVYSDY